jgi:hypothetical protein
MSGIGSQSFDARSPALRAALARILAAGAPGAKIVLSGEFPADASEAGDATRKAIGYGEPIRLTLRHPDGAKEEFVLHTARPDDFGHDRRADRAQNLLLGFDSFAEIPGHVEAVDVGAIDEDGELVSLGRSGEFYLLTRYAPGAPYAEDLRRLAAGGPLRDRDLLRCDRLADYLADLHRRPAERPEMYTRALRDVIGSGEGIFGIVDGYPGDAPGASSERLRAIERACAEYRWRLRGREHRAVWVHGDFHPFNILFDDDDALALLDASRGCRGDAADDVCCLALNFVFFALPAPATWETGFRPLWKRLWDRYFSLTGDRDLLSSAPLYLAWRALVLACPAWYPDLGARERDALLKLVERSLKVGHFEPDWAEELFS